jgi:hypothetical protein
MACRGQRAIHDISRSEVATHCVDGDLNQGVSSAFIRLLLLGDGSRLATAVEAAVWTDAVWPFGLVTVRALAESNRLQRIMRAALGGPGLRMTSFGIWHVMMISSGRALLVGLLVELF